MLSDVALCSRMWSMKVDCRRCASSTDGSARNSQTDSTAVAPYRSVCSATIALTHRWAMSGKETCLSPSNRKSSVTHLRDREHATFITVQRERPGLHYLCSKDSHCSVLFAGDHHGS